MDALIGRKLVKFERLGWHQAGGLDDASVGAASPSHDQFGASWPMSNRRAGGASYGRPRS